MQEGNVCSAIIVTSSSSLVSVGCTLARRMGVWFSRLQALLPVDNKSSPQLVGFVTTSKRARSGITKSIIGYTEIKRRIIKYGRYNKTGNNQTSS